MDWWAINNSITINARNADGSEVKLFERCKQSELFVQDEDAWDMLRPVSGLAYFVSDVSLQVDPKYPAQMCGTDGYEINIGVSDNTYAVRQEIKELFKTFYPTGWGEVYELMKQSILGNTGEINAITDWSGTSGKYTYDGREISMLFNSHGDMGGSIIILAPGAEVPDRNKTVKCDPADYYIFGDGLWGFSSDYARDYTVSRHELDKW